MYTVSIVCQVIIAVGIVNVWVLRRNEPTPWRPDGASNMVEEFEKYGLPGWVRVAVGAVKLILAALLVAGLWYPVLAAGAGALMAILMLAAVNSIVRTVTWCWQATCPPRSSPGAVWRSRGCLNMPRRSMPATI